MDFFSIFIVDLGKINCQTKNRGQTLYLMGANGCDLLENDWFRYHGTVDISSCSMINEPLRPFIESLVLQKSPGYPWCVLLMTKWCVDP